LNKTPYVAVLVIALALRCAAAVYWQSHVPVGKSFVFPDSETYWHLAQTIVRGEPYAYGEFRLFRAPGYPIELATVMAAFGERGALTAIRYIGAVQGTVAVGLVMLLARRLFDRPTAWVAGLLAAIAPGGIGMSILVLSESLFAPLLVASILLWVGAVRARGASLSLAWGMAAGAVAGAATLTRSSWLLFVPACGGWMLIRSPDRAHMIRVAAGTLFAFLAVMAPWWVRNYRVVGRFVPTTLQVGASLYDGWHETADGSSDMRFVDHFVRQQRQFDALETQPRGTFEERLDRRMADAALTWAGANPVRVVRLALVKIFRMWSPWPHARELSRPWIRWGTAAVDVPIMICAVCGVWWYARRDWGCALCVAPAIYLTGLHAIFVGSVRYRQPTMLLLMVLAAAFLTARYRTEENVSPWT